MRHGPAPHQPHRRPVLWALGWSLVLLLAATPPAAAQQSAAPTTDGSARALGARAGWAGQEGERSGGRRLHLRWETDLRSELTVFDPDTVFAPPTDHELRLALWDSPMGRLQYDLTAHEAMLGREGLVSGERMLGVGMGAAAFGYEPATPTERWLAGARWNELSRAEKIQIGVEATVAAGVLWALLSNL